MKLFQIFCLFLVISSAQATILKITKTDDELPAFAKYLHRFEDNELITRTIASSIKFYAIFNSSVSNDFLPPSNLKQNDLNKLQSSTKSQPPLNSKYDLLSTEVPVTHPARLKFDMRACSNETVTYVGLQIGKCYWLAKYEMINGTCNGQVDDKVPVIVDEGDEKFLQIERDCDPLFASNDDYEPNTKRIHIKLEINRDNTGVELFLRDAYYGYPEPNSELVYFIILLAMFIITVILIAASVSAVKFSHLFIKTKLNQD